MEKLIVEVQADLSKLRQQMDGMGNEASAGAGKMKKGFSGIPALFGGLAVAAGGVVAAIGGIGLAMNGINYNANLESSTAAWKTLLGTQDEAKKQMEDIAKFAKNTQFDSSSVDMMAKYMFNAGVEGEAMWKELTKVADVSGAFNLTADSAKEMTRQMSQVRQAGVAYTEDLNILQDRGVPIYKAIADQIGGTVADVKKMASEGKLSSEIYLKAFDGIAKGVEGASADQAKTFNGMMSTLKDNFDVLTGKIMKPVFDLLVKWMPKVISFVEGLIASFDKGGKSGGLKNFQKILTDIFGKDTMEAVKELGKNIQKYIKVAQEVFEKFYPIVYDILKDIFGYLKEIAVPIVKAAVEMISDYIKKLTKFWEENGDTIIKAVKNAWAIISGVIETLMPYIKLIIEQALKKIQVAFEFVTDTIMSVWKIFAGLFAGDWDKMWEGIKDLFKGIFDFVVNFFKSSFSDGMLEKMKEFSLNMVAKVVEWVENTKTKVSEGFKIVKDWVLNKLHEIFIEGPKKLGEAIVQMALAIHNKQQEVKNKIRDMVIGAIATLAAKIIDFYNKGKEFITNMISGIKEKAVGLYEYYKEIMTKGVQVIKDKISTFKNAAKDIIDGLIQGLKENGQKIYNKFLELAKSGWQAFKDFFNIKSPSRLMREAGNFIGIGLIQGLGDQEGDVSKTSTSLAEKLYAPFNENIKVGFDKPNMKDALKNAGVTANALFQSQTNKEQVLQVQFKGDLQMLFDESEARIVEKLSYSIGGSL